ncbi:protein of unknown function [Candidatus Nitrosotalea okcheonensis]|uniref:Uncharacterized protein n=1 Tax=Candidatus Nitrosotalea okcheonensis TaxID=1903276 RepID=A0A2H1FF66_9ARCH|nr:protein of unknown function [Candidatus Nitrosotalea okcheonensis]
MVEVHHDSTIQHGWATFFQSINQGIMTFMQLSLQDIFTYGNS